MRKNRYNFKFFVTTPAILILLFLITGIPNHSFADSGSNPIQSTIRIKACIHDLDQLIVYGNKIYWRTHPTNSEIAYKPGEGKDCPWWGEMGIKISINEGDFEKLPLDDSRWKKYEEEIRSSETNPYSVTKIAYWAGEIDLSEVPYCLNASTTNPESKIISVKKEEGRGDIILEDLHELYIWDPGHGADYYNFSFVYEYYPTENFADNSDSQSCFF